MLSEIDSTRVERMIIAPKDTPIIMEPEGHFVFELMLLLGCKLRRWSLCCLPGREIPEVNQLAVPRNSFAFWWRPILADEQHPGLQKQAEDESDAEWEAAGSQGEEAAAQGDGEVKEVEGTGQTEL